MKNLILTFIAVYSAFVVVACGNDRSGGGVVILPGCVAPNYLDGSGQCVTSNGTIVPTQTRYGVSNCQYANTSCRNSPNYFEVVNTAVYQDFLEKGLGACSNRLSTGWSDCKNWWPGKFEISLTAATNVAANQYCSAQGLTLPASASLYVKAAYVAQGAFQYGGSVFGGFPFNNGLTHEATVNVINDCKGFEVRKTMNRNLLQVLVRNGNLTGNTITYELAWGSSDTGTVAKVFARGVMYRY